MEELGLASHTEMAKLLLGYEVTKNVTMDYTKHAESLDSTSSCFTSTPGQVLLPHTERMKTPSTTAIESGRYQCCYNTKQVADGPSTLAKKRKPIPTSGSFFRKPSSVGLRTRRV